MVTSFVKAWSNVSVNAMVMTANKCFEVDRKLKNEDQMMTRGPDHLKLFGSSPKQRYS